MSRQLQQMLEQVHKLSRAEQLLLISTIAHYLSEEESEETLHIGIPQSNAQVQAPTILKGNKNIDPTALFGIWRNSPRTIEEIREKAWNRN